MSPESKAKPTGRGRYPYRLTGDGFQIVNGGKHFNRPLYGTHARDADSIDDSVLVLAGDMPQVMPILLQAQTGAKGGALSFGVMSDRGGKFLHQFDFIEATYDPGLMRYVLRDRVLEDGEIHLQVVPLSDTEGFIARLEIEALSGPISLIWTYGGLTGFGPRGSHMDYGVLEGGGLHPGDHRDNVFGVDADGSGFRLGNPSQNPGRVFRGMWGFVQGAGVGAKPDDGPDGGREVGSDHGQTGGPDLGSGWRTRDARLGGSGNGAGDGGSCRIADARCLSGSLSGLLASKGGEYPVLACSRRIDRFPFEAYVVIQREAEGDGSPSPAKKGKKVRREREVFLLALTGTFDRCVAHYKEIAKRVVIETPDPFLDKGMEALCLAMDACWHHPTFMHGAWSWHEPYLGWRGLYGADALGWHDRVRTSIRAHAATQIREPDSAEPYWDGPHGYASGGDTRGGLPSMLSGEITHVFYNMVEVYLDHIFYHYQWTGDLEFMREMFPVVRDALDWERRTFDADDDGLYENYLNTWVSDAHWYNGGGCIQSSAYNWRANLMAAEVALRLGYDPEPFRRQADRIKQAAGEVLWLPEKGVFAEYKDSVGLKRPHESPELASIYYPIDFNLADDFQAYQMLRFTEYGLRNEYRTYRHARLIWSSAWDPPLYSSQGLYPQEVLNTALCYYRIGRREEALELVNGCAALLYMGPAPGAITHNVTPGSGSGSTDFTDTVSMFCRAVVEGLFGILPRMQDESLTIMPGFPDRWARAAIRTPDVAYEYQRKDQQEVVRVTVSRPVSTTLKLAAKWTTIESVRLDGRTVDFRTEPGMGHPYVVVQAPPSQRAEFVIDYRRSLPSRVSFPPVAALGDPFGLEVRRGAIQEVKDPQGVLGGLRFNSLTLEGKVKADPGRHIFFVSVKSDDTSWWEPVDLEVRRPLEILQPKLEFPSPWDQGFGWLRGSGSMPDWERTTTSEDAHPASWRGYRRVREVSREEADDLPGAAAGSPVGFSFRLRNNLARPLKSDFVVRFAGEEHKGSVDIGDRSVSGLLVFPVRDPAFLSPGQNPLEVDLFPRRDGFSKSSPVSLNAPPQSAWVAVTVWDLLEKRPKLQEAFVSRLSPLSLDDHLNDRLEEIHQHEFRSPRPKTYSIMTDLKGRPMWDGNLWGYGRQPIVDDSELRGRTDSSGLYSASAGVRFRQVIEGKNAAVVSIWDNYPTSLTVPVGRKASKLYLLIAGSTHPMQSQTANAKITARYEDGTEQVLELINPQNFDDLICAPYHREGVTERIGNNTHAVVLDMLLDEAKTVEDLEIRALSNEVLVGLLGVTLLLPNV